MEELVKKAKNGDKEAFTTLMLGLEKELYKIARARLKNDDDIYDAVQETIIKAFESIKKLKQTRYFKTWIIRILINTTKDIYRRNSSGKELSIEDIESSQTTNNDNIETLLDLNFIYNALKYEDRIIIILYYMEGFTDKEIGKILKLKENTVKTRRTRAKQKIKNVLELGGKYNGWIR